MKGFALGTLVLVVFYLAVKPGSANAAQQGSNVLVSGLRRLLSADVAGIPQRAGAPAAATAAPSSSTGTTTSHQITV